MMEYVGLYIDTYAYFCFSNVSECKDVEKYPGFEIT